MRSEPHILDIQLSKTQSHGTDIPLPEFYFAWSHGVKHDLAIDFELYDNYIALDLAIQMNLKMEPHPDPYFIDDHEFVQHRCELHFRVRSYEKKVWCDVVDLQGRRVLLGRGWLTERHVRYNRLAKSFIYSWMTRVEL